MLLKRTAALLLLCSIVPLGLAPAAYGRSVPKREGGWTAVTAAWRDGGERPR